MNTDLDLNQQSGIAQNPTTQIAYHLPPMFSSSSHEQEVESKPFLFGTSVPNSHVNIHVQNPAVVVPNQGLPFPIPQNSPVLPNPFLIMNPLNSEGGGNWGVPVGMSENSVMTFGSGMNEVPQNVVGGNGSGFDQGVGMGFYPQYPQQAPFSHFNMGITNTANANSPFAQIMLNRRYRRMIRNRETAARSRARKAAYFSQQQLSIQKLREENAFLKAVLKTMIAMLSKMEEQHMQMQISRSHPMPVQSGRYRLV